MADDTTPTVDPVVDPAPTKAAKAKYPAKIKLDVPHGFFDERGIGHHWFKDQVVFEKADVKTLVDRGVPHTVVE